MAIPFTPETVTLDKQRKDKELEILRGYMNHTFATNPTGQTWLQGTILSLNTNGFLSIAASGKGDFVSAQSVKDLSAANGYRNEQNTDANRGDVVGVYFGELVVATKIHSGIASPGYKAVWNGTTIVFTNNPSGSDKVLGKFLHADGTDITAGINASAGDYTTPSDEKAIVAFNLPVTY